MARFLVESHTSAGARVCARAADDVSTCVTALVGCHGDAACRRSLQAMLSSCRGLPPQPCNRSACLAAVRALYSPAAAAAASTSLVEPLRFCRCATGDDRCAAIRRSLQPACSRLQLPPPSCLDLVARCHDQSDCRSTLLLPRSRYETGAGLVLSLIHISEPTRPY